MNGNTATLLILEDQTIVMPMEARIARIESDVGHIKATLAAQAESLKELRGDMKAANESIAGLRCGLGELRADMKGDIGMLREEIKSSGHALEVKMIRWIIGTVVTAGGLGFSIARFFQ